MLEIPENFTDFLHWVKERTEEFWNKTQKQVRLIFAVKIGLMVPNGLD